MNSQSIFDDSFGAAVLLAVLSITGLLVWGLGRVCIAYRGARRPLLLGAIGVGGVAGYGVLRISSGYLAGLIYGQDVFMMVLVACVSAVFATIPRTRRCGLFGLIGTGAMLVGFFAVYLGGYYFGLYAWANDRPVPIR